jgi:hypothetical protein
MAMVQLDSNPTPSSINAPGLFGIEQIFFNNVTGVFNGNSQRALTIAFCKGAVSQFQILGTSTGFAQFDGEAVFGDTVNSPIFTPGVYNFTVYFSSGTLTISEIAGPVPDPAGNGDPKTDR